MMPTLSPDFVTAQEPEVEESTVNTLNVTTALTTEEPEEIEPEAIISTEEPEEEELPSMEPPEEEEEEEEEENELVSEGQGRQCMQLEGVCLRQCESPADVIQGVSCGNDVMGQPLICCDD
ncbi:hypothetical protein ACOMHN_063160 [Nucella lapillus]